MRLPRQSAASSTHLLSQLPLRNAPSSTLAFLAPYAKRTNYGPLLGLKSAKTTPQANSSKPSAVPPLRPHLTARIIVHKTIATTTSVTTPLTQLDLAAPPMAPATHTVGMVPQVVTATLTMLTGAHGGDLLTSLHPPHRPQCL